jgi:hypothetical protein
MLTRIIFTTRAAQSVGTEDLQTLVDEYALYNLRAQVTGVLLHINSCFVQAIEGADADVYQFLAHLKADKRHTDFKMLDHASVPSRTWPNWSCGFASSEGYNGVVIDRYSGDDGKLDPYSLDGRRSAALMMSLRVIRGPSAEADDLISQL